MQGHDEQQGHADLAFDSALKMCKLERAFKCSLETCKLWMTQKVAMYALYYLELQLAIRIFRHLKDGSMVMSLEELLDVRTFIFKLPVTFKCPLSGSSTAIYSGVHALVG